MGGFKTSSRNGVEIKFAFNAGNETKSFVESIVKTISFADGSKLDILLSDIATFDFETIDKEFYQPVGTVNYPTKEDKFTRITEYKHMTDNEIKSDKTIIMREYPGAYKKDSGMIPYYPINNDESSKVYNQYLEESKKYKNLYMLGRLAQYKYYNMDLIINDALRLFETIKTEGDNHE